MPVKRYSPKVKAQARAFVIYEGLGVEDAAQRLREMLGDKAPSKSTLANWSKVRDDDGLTWIDRRKQMVEEFALSMSPQGMQIEFMRRVKEMLADKSIGHGQFSDAIAKLTKAMQQVVDPSLQFPAIFHTLNDQLEFVQSRFAGITPEQMEWLIDMLEAYRDYVRERMVD